MSELRLFWSYEHDCGYLDARRAREAVVDPDAPLNPRRYEQLLAQGFRRSGSVTYRPMCPGCSACVPARLPVSQFKPRRRHRRALRASAHLDVRACDANFSDAHRLLYRRYLSARHSGTPMLSENPEQQSLEFLMCRWGDVRLLEYRDGTRLVGFAVTDFTPNAASAMYTVFDPDWKPRRAVGGGSLGTWSILKQIECAQAQGLHWLYLGYWISSCRNMAYKSSFQPLELRRNGRWQQFADSKGIVDNARPQSDRAAG